MVRTFFSKINYFFFIIVLYIFIYSPYLRSLQMGIGKIMVFFAVIYFCINFKKIKYILLFKIEIAFILVLVLCTFLTSLWGDGSTRMMPYLHFQFIIDCILVPIFIYVCFNNKIDFSRLNEYLVIVGILASFITVYLVLNPVFNIYLRENIIVDDLDSETVQDSLKYIRGFTFSESSTFGFGITQGIIFGLALNETKSKSKFYLPLLLLLISILFNARVGFVVVIISFLILYKRLKISFIFYILVFVTIVGSYLKYSDFADENSQTIDWATDFFTESFDFFSGKKDSDSTYDALTGRMFFLPESPFGILFGEGKIVMGRDIGSDVGYVNQMFIGGLFYLFLLILILYFFYLNFERLAKKSFIGPFFIVVLLVVNYKGSSMFTSHSFLRLFILIYVVLKSSRYDQTYVFKKSLNVLNVKE
jgi:hypothetical protein